MALPMRVSRSAQADPFEMIRRDFDSLFGRYLGDGGESPLAPYGVDIREDADHYYVEADLPGFRKEDVEITLENGTLTIEAERREEQKPQEEQKSKEGHKPNYLLRERRYRHFVRSFTLPPNANDANVKARLENGCLLITLDKREESKPRKISVGEHEQPSSGQQVKAKTQPK